MNVTNEDFFDKSLSAKVFSLEEAYINKEIFKIYENQPNTEQI